MEIKELAKKYYDGDKSCYDELYEKSYQLSYKIIRGMVKNDEDAKDLAQDSFIKALEKLPALPNPEGFGAYLTTVSKNIAKDFLDSAYYRKVKKYNFNTFDDEGNEVAWEDITESDLKEYQPETALDEKTKKDILSEILSSLSNEQRQAVLLCYYDGLTAKAAAEVLGVEPSTIRGRLDLSKKAIKVEVNKIQERDGIKLYNVSIIPFLLWLFAQFKQEYPTSSALLERELFHVRTESTIDKRSLKDKKAVKEVSHSKQTASLAAKKAGVSTAAKIGVTVAVAACVGAGGYFLSNHGSFSNTKPIPTTVTESYSEDEMSEEATPSPSATSENKNVEYADVSVTVPDGWAAKEKYYSFEKGAFVDSNEGEKIQPVLVLYDGEKNDDNPHMYIYSYGQMLMEYEYFPGTVEEMNAGDHSYYCYLPSEQRLLMQGTNATDYLVDQNVIGYNLISDASFENSMNTFFIDYYTEGKGSKDDEAIQTVLSSLTPEPMGSITVSGDVTVERNGNPGMPEYVDDEKLYYYETKEIDGVKKYRVSSIGWISAGENVKEN